MRTQFKAIPLPLRELVAEIDLPADMPKEMKRLLTEPGNMYEFVKEMIQFTESLTIDQKKFKEHLK
ncbi:hypothetical protein LZZ85_27285 [Terrimonas sp. NA20]|uniref:Uncharacterized protein n=1 Tax=Terrimonas ginsenosidimutans TaxID=2908004 RepID=A0ABS9L080_9BACT|nr:hypothetical protein [Terrimonas ginsenosidimutans]MCG2618037.1 hypothetical protein [Terrimonas ginsenosidimutans]